MATKLEQLKTKLDKLSSAQKDIEKLIADAELDAIREEEFNAKSAAVLTDIAQYAQRVFDARGLAMPDGKVVVIGVTDGIWTAGRRDASVARKAGEPKAAGAGGGTGKGRTTITYEGKQMSWAQFCDLKGGDYGAGSAHKYAYDHFKEEHDKVVHECNYAKPAKVEAPVAAQPVA